MPNKINFSFKRGIQSIFTSGGVGSPSSAVIPRSVIEDKENARKFDEVIRKNKCLRRKS